MNILSSAYAVLDAEWNYENLCSPFTRIYFVRSGEGVINYENTSLTLTPGNIYIIPSGLKISLHCEQNLEKLFFHFKLQRFGTQDLFFGHKKIIVLKGQKAKIDYAVKNWEKGDAESAIAIRGLLYSLALRALKKGKIDLGKIETCSSVTKRALDYVESNLRASLTAEDIAKSLYVSAGSLQKRFKREIGLPIGKYITNRVMFLAEQMLHTHEYSIKEISDSLGFCDQFYFSRVFTATYGISPTQYKKNIKI